MDSTGLKLCGAGEWLQEGHGTKTHRSWRKLHIGVDADTGQILASLLTGHGADDGAQVGPPLDQIADPIASFTGDGAYDQDAVTASVAERHPEAAIIVPPRSNAVPSETAATAPTQRDRSSTSIKRHQELVLPHSRCRCWVAVASFRPLGGCAGAAARTRHGRTWSA